MKQNVWIQIASITRTTDGQDKIDGYVWGTCSPVPQNAQHGRLEGDTITIETGKWTGQKLSTAAKE